MQKEKSSVIPIFKGTDKRKRKIVLRSGEENFKKGSAG